MIVLLASCAAAGCSGPSPADVEAERARANAEWNTQAGAAEHARQVEENRMVQQELAAHEQREDADEAREERTRLANQAAERDRLSALVAAKFPDPQAVQLAGVHWNALNTALCGSASGRNDSGTWSDNLAFVASGDQVLIDSAEAAGHAHFIDATQSSGCTQ